MLNEEDRSIRGGLNFEAEKSIYRRPRDESLIEFA